MDILGLISSLLGLLLGPDAIVVSVVAAGLFTCLLVEDVRKPD